MKKRRILAKAALFSAAVLLASSQAQGGGYESNEKMGIPGDVDPVHETYLPVMMDQDFDTMMKKDKEMKPEIMERQEKLLERRYDLSDNPSEVMMSAGRKPVQ
ncbi:MAG: hypothetical protein ACOCTJ_00995, partial [Desulfobia sp.]